MRMGVTFAELRFAEVGKGACLVCSERFRNSSLVDSANLDAVSNKGAECSPSHAPAKHRVHPV